MKRTLRALGLLGGVVQAAGASQTQTQTQTQAQPQMQSTLSATAAPASQQAYADAALGQQAQARKEHVTTLFLGKKCKPSDTK
ncbi:MAG: hypothetical protein H7143_10395 [Pseudorhodobacter sp.]|nr:hypothetical protein [Rhizobacter sp.]